MATVNDNMLRDMAKEMSLMVKKMDSLVDVTKSLVKDVGTATFFSKASATIDTIDMLKRRNNKTSEISSKQSSSSFVSNSNSLLSKSFWKNVGNELVDKDSLALLPMTLRTIGGLTKGIAKGTVAVSKEIMPDQTRLIARV